MDIREECANEIAELLRLGFAEIEAKPQYYLYGVSKIVMFGRKHEEIALGYTKDRIQWCYHDEDYLVTYWPDFESLLMRVLIPLRKAVRLFRQNEVYRARIAELEATVANLRHAQTQ